MKHLQKLANADEAALAHDLALGIRKNNKPYPRWQGSEAEGLLKLDIDNGLNQIMRPKALRASRPQYLQFPLDVFRNHIYQETRARMERPYWLARKKEKEEEKRNKSKKKKKQQKPQPKPIC